MDSHSSPSNWKGQTERLREQAAAQSTPPQETAEEPPNVVPEKTGPNWGCCLLKAILLALAGFAWLLSQIAPGGPMYR